VLLPVLPSVCHEVITNVGQTGSAASGWQLDETPPGRLYFRLIRLRSPTFAYYRVSFSTQVMDGGD
jgi:hypothetical protein